MSGGIIAVVIVLCYLGLLLGLGLFSNRFFKGTATDYFLASRSRCRLGTSFARPNRFGLGSATRISRIVGGAA